MLIIIVSSLEWFWRNHNYRPSVIDDYSLWSYYREQVYDKDDKKTVVLIGSSRIQLGFSMSTFRSMFPNYRLVQLAVPGKLPMAVLKDLATDPNFNGIVICSGTAHAFKAGTRYQQQAYLNHFEKKWNVNTKLNRLIALSLQEQFVIFSYQVRMLRLINGFYQDHSLPKASFITTHADRSRLADYSSEDYTNRPTKLGAIGVSKKTKALAPKQWLNEAKWVNQWVAKIQQRDGQVVFVRFPTAFKSLLSKKLYWDRFANETSAVTIHFRNMPGLKTFNMPDTSHLDYRDAPIFTENLLNILVQKGVLQKNK